jgi:ribosomal protein S20
MAITKAMSATLLERTSTMLAPSNSIKRLDLALKSGDVEQAKRALETVKQNLPFQRVPMQELTMAISNLSEAIRTGDLAKANEAFTGLQEQAKKVTLETQQSDKTTKIPNESPRDDVSRTAAVGILDIKA